MNEILRLLRRSLRPFGYDIRKRGTYNLLPFRSIEKFPDLILMRKEFDYDGDQKRGLHGNTDTLKIILRTCIRDDRNVKAHHQLTHVSLEETVLRCMRSVITSINNACEQAKIDKTSLRPEVIVLDDHSDEIYLTKIRALAKELNCPWALHGTEIRGQGASLHQQFSLAKTDDALYYFCEDDYLHEKEAIYEMWSFYRQIYAFTYRHLVLHPQESESLYGNAHYPSYLLLSPYRHWRTTSHATHMLLTHSSVVRDYWNYFENTKFVGNRKKRRLGSESKTTNQIFQKLPCFVPIPALAGHLQQADSLPPFFNWKKLWADNA